MGGFLVLRDPNGPNNPCASNDVGFLSVTLKNCNATSTSLSLATPPSEKSETTTPEEEDPVSFYSCHASTGTSSSDGSDGVDGPEAPPDTTELTIVYDYELRTSAPLNDDILSSFEKRVARDLAGRLGLIDCDGRPGGLFLRRRSLQRAEVTALDSAPVDEVLDDGRECGAPANGLDPSASCAPVRGYTTAYLPNSSSADAAKSTESQLLAWIEEGMQSDSYTSDDVVKASFVGAPGTNVGRGGAGNAANLPSVGTRGAESDEGGADPPLLAIGISMSVLALALAIGLGLYLRRKRRSKRFSDGPDDMGADPIPSPAQSAPAEPRDPDDVLLLSCRDRDRLDLRSVVSDDGDASTTFSVETENHTCRGERELKQQSTDETEASDASDGARDSGGGAGAGSALAAMGVASTLATRSFAPPAGPAAEGEGP